MMTAWSRRNLVLFSIDGQNCTRLGENPLTASRVCLISFNDDEDDSKTILRAMTMMQIAVTTSSIKIE